MALFGDKKKPPEKAATPATGATKAAASDASDFDSPVENVSLTAAKKAPPKDDRAAQAAREAEEAERAMRDYGIDQAIQLMRLLPVDLNVELVVQVVKKTLESTNVKVAKIIDDASRKQKDIEIRVSTLEREISELEREIQTREGEIERLQTDHKETTSVKERLQLAEQLAWAGKGGQPGAPGAPGQPPPLQEPDGPKQTHEEALTTPARLGTQG